MRRLIRRANATRPCHAGRPAILRERERRDPIVPPVFEVQSHIEFGIGRAFLHNGQQAGKSAKVA